MRLSCFLFLSFASFSLLRAQTIFVTGSGYSAPPGVIVAPGQVATFYVGGLLQTAAELQKVAAQLNVGTAQQAATVISAKPMSGSIVAVTVLIPFSILPGTMASIQFSEGACAENACTSPVTLNVVPELPHIISTCDTFYAAPTTPCQLAVTHQNGSLVTSAAPAKGGEIVTIWALGLGVPASGVPAPNSGPIAMDDIVLNTAYSVTTPPTVAIGIVSTPYLFAGLTSPATGLYQINFTVPQPPTDLQSCTQASEWFTTVGGNLSVSIYRNVEVIEPVGVGIVSSAFFSFAGTAGISELSSICVSL